jgi:glycosyltransferase involved in cell wall biosynthesis
LLIEAFAALKKQSKYAHARLWLAGSGSEYDTIKAQIDNLQLEKDVIMHGLLSRQRILEAIQQSDSIVLSSDYETFGVVLIEGMLFGKPVIATKCGGPESFVNDTCGILIETGNVEQLADAMAWQMDNQDVYSATSIRNYALDQFGAASFLRKINEIYPN